MKLYSGSSQQFIKDTVQNQISEKLKNAFFHHFRYEPSPGEVGSWRNSLRAIKDVFQEADLTDHGVILEYQLPLMSRRLDCMICGKDKEKRENAIIIELKQWDKCRDASGINEVSAFVGGDNRELLHPSVQVGRYKTYLQDTHTAFYEMNDPIVLNACAYLHNYHYYTNDIIFAAKFLNALTEFPLFTADDTTKLINYLYDKLQKGEGLDVLKRIESSKYRPSKKLMQHVGNIIKGRPEYILLDEQLIVYDKVFSILKEGFHDKQKVVLIVKGGPGTGKSVIAINLMADLSLQSYNTQYATGSRAFTQTLWEAIGSRGAAQFKYFNSYIDAEYNSVDVLICDESHRIREASNTRFTPKTKRTNLPQVDELIQASKVSVFFIDDDQVVRPGEIGSTDYIKQHAEINNCKTFEYELDVQFRCSGSESFINWINNTLDIRKTPNVLWNSNEEEFEFKIYQSPQDLETAIRHKHSKGFSARLTAGYCWFWSEPDREGKLLNDVVINDFKQPWNAKPDAKKLAPGIPKATLWAYDKRGIDQIGCVYTAQGFEFDYVGVIFGNDLVYNFDENKWHGKSEYSYDTVVKRSKDKFIDLVKNTYRVLLTRGMKGCFVYFLDKNTEHFFRSRME